MVQLNKIPLAVRWTFWWLYTATIATLSLLPSKSFGRPPSHSDLIAHFVMYGVYVWMWHWAAPPPQQRRWLWVLGILCFSAAYGMAMEFMQGAVRPDDRACSVIDMAANTAGAIAFSLLALTDRFRKHI